MRAGPEPCLEVEIPAAAMRVQSDDARARRGDRAGQVAELGGRHAKLRVQAAGPDFLVVTVAARRIQPQEDFASVEERWPVAQDRKVVDGHAQPAFQGPFVLGARGEIRREEQALALDSGHLRENAFDLGA